MPKPPGLLLRESQALIVEMRALIHARREIARSYREAAIRSQDRLGARLRELQDDAEAEPLPSGRFRQA